MQTPKTTIAAVAWILTPSQPVRLYQGERKKRSFGASYRIATENKFYATHQGMFSSAKWHAIADDRLSVAECFRSTYCNDAGIVMHTSLLLIIIIIIKRISRAPIYHTRWQHRALYNNTNHTHAHAHTHPHTASNEGMGRAIKKKQFRNNY